MTAASKNALMLFRRRQKRQGIVRLEVQVRKDDAPLVRDVAAALADPLRRSEARALLQAQFGEARPTGLKALLAGAPLEGIELVRERDLDRDVDL